MPQNEVAVWRPTVLPPAYYAISVDQYERRTISHTKCLSRYGVSIKCFQSVGRMGEQIPSPFGNVFIPADAGESKTFLKVFF